MIYLRSFSFLSRRADESFTPMETCYASLYPYGVFPRIGLERIEFAPLTILYGGNGSGKTTALNVMAEKARLSRHSAFNDSPFFARYVAGCGMDAGTLPEGSRIITSDDVFDELLDMRAVNEGINNKREELFQKWQEVRALRNRTSNPNPLNGLEEFSEWRERAGILKKRATESKFVKGRIPFNLVYGSNGESAFRSFVEALKEGSLYLLDEPENSLSAAWQMKLAGVIEGMARFDRCQFIVATHSPFLLAMKGAKILDLDTEGAPVRHWTELENVRLYRDFFASHEREFATMGDDGDE